jgi:drug/metabolite transporter (DMT)-like permease
MTSTSELAPLSTDPIKLWPIYLKLTGVALLWGGTFIAGHQLSETIPPIVSAVSRFAVAALLLALWLWKQEGKFPSLSLQQFGAVCALGATGIFAYNLFFFAALSELPASRTALLVSLNPIVTALLLGTLLGERLGIIRWIGIGLAFIGAAIIVSRGDLVGAFHDLSSAMGKGELFMMGGVFSWAAYTIIGRYALKGLSPLAATTYAAVAGLILLAIFMSINPPELQAQMLNWSNIASIFYLGALGTVIGFVWYYQGVQAIGPSRTSIFNNLVPVFGVVLASILLKEPILSSMLIGGVLVITGVAITNRGKLK